MDNPGMILCRDINGEVHIVRRSELIPRTSVYGVITHEEGVLLIRNLTGNSKNWDLPGGGVEAGEGLLDALSREIKEETGLDVTGEPQKICEFVEYFYDLESEKGWESTRHFYKVAASGAPHMEGNGDDVAGVRYFKELTSPEISPVTREIVRLARRS